MSQEYDDHYIRETNDSDGAKAAKENRMSCTPPLHEGAIKNAGVNPPPTKPKPDNPPPPQGLTRDTFPKVHAMMKGLEDRPVPPTVIMNAAEARERGVDLTEINDELANRPTCLDCARKHVGSARALLVEARLGYARHAWYAVGELAQAEAELVDKYDFLAEYVRGVRLDLMASLDPATTLTAGGPSIDPSRIKYPDWDTLMDTLVDTAVTK